MAIELNQQQQDAVNHDGNVIVTACPGSGKTRVLTHRVLRELQEVESSKHRVIALTFTNRAADEIKGRIDHFEIPLHQLWSGTIHAFALEWILRPYAGYAPELRTGFQVADEFYTKRALDDLKGRYGVPPYRTVTTRLDRNGNPLAPAGPHRQIVDEYHNDLRVQKLIDFDMVLAIAFRLLRLNPEVSRTLGSFMRLICIDEFQDTQDLQYGILSEIVKASAGFSKVFIVGDDDQAIYASLGGIARTVEEIKDEFELDELTHYELGGNYRSSQRIIRFCQHFRGGDSEIVSLARHADQLGCITFCDQEVTRDSLPSAVASLVRHNLNVGVPPHEICVLAPRWRFITHLGRALVRELPDVHLDAPGLSPLRVQQDSVWYKLAKLFLTVPEPELYRSRLRLAGEVVRDLENAIGREIDAEIRVPRRILRLRNAIVSEHEDGIEFLQDVFDQFLNGIAINIGDHDYLQRAQQSYFDAAISRLADPEYNVPSDVESLRKLFRHPAGVVVNTCHGTKGEEYTTVICFGLLRGYIPHWEEIFDDDVDEEAESRKLLYVVCSRSKSNIHLIAEHGRETQSGNPYETTYELAHVVFDYDEKPLSD